MLEAYLLGRSNLGYVGVGLIEEGVKLIALWWVARRLHTYVVRDGIVLGATVGFGFAAFESAGYAFNALFTMKGLSLGSLVETEILRGILTPVGHGLWTGILGGVLFHSARNGRLRISLGLVIWYLVVSGLHAFWDASGGIAAVVVLILTLNSTQMELIQLGQVPQPTQEQAFLFTIVNWAFLLLDAIVGVVLLLIWARRRT